VTLGAQEIGPLLSSRGRGRAVRLPIAPRRCAAEARAPWRRGLPQDGSRVLYRPFRSPSRYVPISRIQNHEKPREPEAPRPVRVLHVEDQPIHRAVVARQLRTLEEYEFAILPAEGEDEALALFEQVKFELVILDYYLKQGDGLSCLERLRRLDRSVPVIAVSGGRSSEMIVGLMSLGIDAYVSKLGLHTDLLAKRVRESLVRAETLRDPAVERAGKPLQLCSGRSRGLNRRRARRRSTGSPSGPPTRDRERVLDGAAAPLFMCPTGGHSSERAKLCIKPCCRV
jgi:DNA-binding NarL/FixJ family response regulator